MDTLRITIELGYGGVDSEGADKFEAKVKQRFEFTALDIFDVDPHRVINQFERTLTESISFALAMEENESKQEMAKS